MITGTLNTLENVNRVCVNIDNGPWEIAEGTENWHYTINYSELVKSVEYRYNPITNEIETFYIRGIVYGDVDISIAVFDTYNTILDQTTLGLTIIPELPVSDTSSGFYADDVLITLTARPDVSIYYTLDGSDPAITGIVYTQPITLTQTTEVRARAVSENNVFSYILTLDIIIDRTGAPDFTIQYYSDPECTLSLGNNPYLNEGIYYLSIQANKPCISNPTISIDAQGIQNDVIDDTTICMTSTTYVYQRMINPDISATSEVLEDISITGTDMLLNIVTDVSPLNELEKAWYTDTILPGTGSITIVYGDIYRKLLQ